MWELQIYENIHKPLHSDEVFLYFYFLFECFQAQKRPLRRENAADATLQCRICRKNRRQTPKVRLLKIAQLSTPRREKLYLTLQTSRLIPPAGPMPGWQRKRLSFIQAYLLSIGASNLGAQRKYIPLLPPIFIMPQLRTWIFTPSSVRIQ